LIYTRDQLTEAVALEARSRFFSFGVSGSVESAPQILQSPNIFSFLESIMPAEPTSDNFCIAILANPEFGSRPEVDITGVCDDSKLAKLSEVLIRKIAYYWTTTPGTENYVKGMGIVIRGVLDYIEITFRMPHARARLPLLVGDLVLRESMQTLEELELMPTRCSLKFEYTEEPLEQSVKDEFDALAHYAPMMLHYLMIARMRIFGRAALYYQIQLTAFDGSTMDWYTERE
jgi:hypothetical protein